MAKIQAVWAIDIGQAALKALKLVPGETPEQVVAEAFDFIEYPKILSQPDADAEELVREALTTFLGRNELKGARVAIAVPGQAGLVKFIKLPPVEKKRIPDIVKFEARQQIPFALDEVIWDYQQIGGDSAGGDDEDEGFTPAEVGLFAMKRDQINRAILPLQNAGIEVDIVQMSPISLYNYAAFDLPRTEDGSVVLLDVGADNTDLIITDGVRIWQRNVPIGGNHFTRALTKELKLTFAKAEHLKRNATKAPDPRAVFTAMRGVFNDFSSEISRSIGFYSSVNRQAKIAKIVGLGNGFKLPGLQKFLQQNLNYEVEKLENYPHLVGEEVTAAPQFQENLMSFAVTYGLGVQGLGLAPLKTNLLPPEIEQVRMVRRKKPWALAASALLMLGFSAAFFGQWSAWAKVSSEEFKSAVSQANQAASSGDRIKSEFESAKGAFTSKLEEGKALTAESAKAASWPALLKKINDALPNAPEILQKNGLDPEAPENQALVRDLRVHIDAVLPRYRTDLQSDWYANLPDMAKNYMHPYDRQNPPQGEGWVIQIFGHHYNPTPYGETAKRLSPRERSIALGPIPYLTQKVVPWFWTPAMRQFGINHAALVWVDPDYEWVTSKAAGGYKLPTAKEALARVGGESAGMGGGSGMMGMMGMMGGMQEMTGSGMMGSGMMMGPMNEMANMEAMYGAMSSSSYGPGMMGGQAQTKEGMEETKLVRTDFLIQLVWQPPKPDAEPKTIEEISKELTDAAAKAEGSIQVSAADEQKFIQESAESTKQAQQEIQAKVQEVMKKAATTAPAAATPSAGPAAPRLPRRPRQRGSGGRHASGHAWSGAPRATGGSPGHPVGSASNTGTRACARQSGGWRGRGHASSVVTR